MSREVENEQEMLDKDEQAVSQLVGGLKHVEAPANFERRVMTRIANGEPKRQSLFSFPAVGYMVPALLVILVAAFFVLKLRQQTPAEHVTVAANISSTPSNPDIPVPESTLTTTPKSTEPVVAKVDDKPEVKSHNRRGGGSIDILEPTNSSGNGSFVKALRQTRTPNPEGVDPKASISVKTMLDGAGMSVEFENGWQVKSVTENGPAQKSGIRVGDVITALDGRGIDSTTYYKGTASFQTITVRRGGSFILLRIPLR